MPRDYSVILPAFNETEELPATLTAIRHAMSAIKATGECIVVDNNSDDDTAAVAKQHGADKVVFEPINQISRARNAGAARSAGRYLIFIDADTRIEAALLAEALHQLETKACAGGGSIVEFEGDVNFVGRLCIQTWEQISKLTATAAGSFIFCRRDAFDAVGGFDESLYASEEVRFSRRMRKWGKTHGLFFKILDHAPAKTSARKLKWYSGLEILGWVGLMIIMPLA
ncbi:MAG: glycosyltransferase, partial [Verrucomicrobia bacterium]|nr:glycosyltransferase [Verrucomicrobiota bacterium]